MAKKRTRKEQTTQLQDVLAQFERMKYQLGQAFKQQQDEIDQILTSIGELHLRTRFVMKHLTMRRKTSALLDGTGQAATEECSMFEAFMMERENFIQELEAQNVENLRQAENAQRIAESVRETAAAAGFGGNGAAATSAPGPVTHSGGPLPFRRTVQ